MKVKKLKKVLNYNSKTGMFTWKIRVAYKIKIGDKAGTLHHTGYHQICIKGKIYLTHRLAWLYVYGYFPVSIDHINHIKDDNRIANLREVSHQENQKNRALSKANKSGITGVHWDETYKLWRARIAISGKTVHLGKFLKFSEAVDARKLAEVTYGFHENHGK